MEPRGRSDSHALERPKNYEGDDIRTGFWSWIGSWQRDQRVLVAETAGAKAWKEARCTGVWWRGPGVGNLEYPESGMKTRGRGNVGDTCWHVWNAERKNSGLSLKARWGATESQGEDRVGGASAGGTRLGRRPREGQVGRSPWRPVMGWKPCLLCSFLGSPSVLTLPLLATCWLLFLALLGSPSPPIWCHLGPYGKWAVLLSPHLLLSSPRPHVGHTGNYDQLEDLKGSHSWIINERKKKQGNQDLRFFSVWGGCK